MSDVIDRVARGAAWLDENYPGWYAKIDLSILDLGNCTQCVLGQIYTGYIPADEQGQILAQAIAQAVKGYEDAQDWADDYRALIANGEFGGYQILTYLHGLPLDGEEHGFVSAVDVSDDQAREDAEYSELLDEWTRVIVSRRLAGQRCDRELVLV